MKLGKKLIIAVVVLFAVVGIGGTVAFAAGEFVWTTDIKANYDVADLNLDEIKTMLSTRDTEIDILEKENATLVADKGDLDNQNTKLQNKLETVTAAKENADAKVVEINNTLKTVTNERNSYKGVIDKVTAALSTFNNTIDNTNGTAHKLTAAIALIDTISKEFGTQANLAELKGTLEEAENSDLELQEADVLMEQVKDETQEIIDTYKVEERTE